MKSYTKGDKKGFEMFLVSCALVFAPNNVNAVPLIACNNNNPLQSRKGLLYVPGDSRNNRSRCDTVVAALRTIGMDEIWCQDHEEKGITSGLGVRERTCRDNEDYHTDHFSEFGISGVDCGATYWWNDGILVLIILSGGFELKRHATLWWSR